MEDGIDMGPTSDEDVLAATFPPTLFPARSDDLVAEARARLADEALVRQLEQIPRGPYDNTGEVWDQIQRLGGT